jgi:hypothetical protein
MNIDYKEHQLYMSWCINNGIKIYAEPISNIEYRLIIEYVNGKKIISKKNYKIKPTKNEEIWYDVIYNLYKVLYFKHNIELNNNNN